MFPILFQENGEVLFGARRDWKRFQFYDLVRGLNTESAQVVDFC